MNLPNSNHSNGFKMELIEALVIIAIFAAIVIMAVRVS